MKVALEMYTSSLMQNNDSRRYFFELSQEQHHQMEYFPVEVEMIRFSKVKIDLGPQNDASV